MYQIFCHQNQLPLSKNYYSSTIDTFLLSCTTLMKTNEHYQNRVSNTVTFSPLWVDPICPTVSLNVYRIRSHILFSDDRLNGEWKYFSPTPYVSLLPLFLLPILVSDPLLFLHESPVWEVCEVNESWGRTFETRGSFWEIIVCVYIKVEDNRRSSLFSRYHHTYIHWRKTKVHSPPSMEWDLHTTFNKK